MIELKHPFVLRCINLNDLFQDCQDLSTYMSRITKQSRMTPEGLTLEPFQNPQDAPQVQCLVIDANKYKGDSLELLGEALIKLSPMDKRNGICNYEPVLSHDRGVDGFGTSLSNLRPATVQFKWRIPNAILTANRDHLSNFTSSSMFFYGVLPQDTDNMLIITTGKDLHHFTDNEMFSGKVRTINYDLLKKLVDGNLAFWQMFREAVFCAKNKVSPKIQ